MSEAERIVREFAAMNPYALGDGRHCAFCGAPLVDGMHYRGCLWADAEYISRQCHATDAQSVPVLLCAVCQAPAAPDRGPYCLWHGPEDAPKGLNARRRALGLPTYDELPMPDVAKAPEPFPPLPDAHAIGRARLRDVLGLHPATERADDDDGRNAWDDETVRRGMKGGGA